LVHIFWTSHTGRLVVTSPCIEASPPFPIPAFLDLRMRTAWPLAYTYVLVYL